MSNRLGSAALALIFALSCNAAEREPAPLDVTDQSAPTFSVYGPQDGLSDEIWATIGFDAQGFTWAGSASELARFDGYRWALVPFPQARSLVRDMEPDSDGNLWAIFEREGLARYDGTAWSLAGGEQMFHHRFSSIRRADGTRELWLGHARGLWHLENGNWVDDPGNDALPPGLVVRIEQTQALFGGPRQWVLSSEAGLWFRPLDGERPSGPWRRFEMPGFEQTLLPTDLVRSVDGDREELWLLSYGKGLRRLRDDGLRVWRSADGELPTEALYSALATHNAAGERLLWICSRAGLLRIRGDTVAVFDRRHGLPSDAVRGIKLQRGIDGVDLLWLATEGGIARAALAESQWQTVSLLGARENGTFGVLLEPDGHGGERLWVGASQQGLGLLADGAWRYFTRASGALPSEGVRAIWRVTGPDGQPWRLLSLLGGKLMRIDDALNFAPMQTPWPGDPDEAATFALAREIGGVRELWFGTLRTGIYRLRDGAWTHFGAAGAEDPWVVLGLAEQVDARGRSWLWAATNQGLARFDGERWTLLTALPGVPADGHRSVKLLAHGARTLLWSGSNRHGVVRLDVTDPLAPVAAALDVPPAPDPTVYSVLPDRAGRIYICTNNGVQQLTPRGAGYVERVFRRRDGLVHDECNTNTQFIDAHDRYWVGTLGGLSVYDPRIQTASTHTRPKPLVFTAVEVDSVHRDPPRAGPLELPAGTRELHVAFSLLAQQRERESTYRSRLRGFLPDWTEWSGVHERAFTALPPGDYALEVEARDWAGTPSAARELALSVQAFWWQRPLTHLMFALLALLAAAVVVLAYNRNLRARQRQLTREVAARTVELNAANARLTELSYVDPLTSVANRRRLTEAIEAAIERARDRALPIGLIVVDVDHFKEYNDRHGHLSGDAALRAVAQALESATRKHDLFARFGGEEFACLLPDAPPDVVAAIAERMRALVEALPPRAIGNDTQTLTISAGTLSRVPAPHETAADLLGVTDAALYRAKRAGRNRVCSA